MVMKTDFDFLLNYQLKNWPLPSEGLTSVVLMNIQGRSHFYLAVNVWHFTAQISVWNQEEEIHIKYNTSAKD